MAKRERGTGGLIKIAGCKYWYAQFYQGGKQRRVSTKTAVKAVAQGILRNLMVVRDHGKPFVGDLKKLRYEHLRTMLLDSYRMKEHKSLQVLANGEETIWPLSALDKFYEGKYATQITTESARQFVKARQAEGTGNAAINRSLGLLRRMLNLAKDEGRIPSVPKIHFLKEPSPRKGFLELPKFNELLSHIPANLKPLIVFLYYCGVRMGEALQVDWSQVDLTHGVIELEREQTKTSEPRIVPLPAVLVEMLKGIEPKEGTVFDGTGLRSAWEKAVMEAGVPDLTVHDMRRSAIRNLVRAGVSEQVAMRISGHRSRSIFARYNIVSQTDVLEAMGRLEQFSEKQVKTTEELSRK
jgi:integrase